MVSRRAGTFVGADILNSIMKWINKISLRKITVDNDVYLWKRAHYHLEEYEMSPCIEKVIIYLEGYKNSSLQLFFRQEDNLILSLDIEKEQWCVGYPNSGVIWKFVQGESPSKENININLNRPAVISILIQYYIENGWNPKKSKRPFIVKDALKLMEEISFPLGIT